MKWNYPIKLKGDDIQLTQSVKKYIITKLNVYYNNPPNRHKYLSNRHASSSSK